MKTFIAVFLILISNYSFSQTTGNEGIVKYNITHNWVKKIKNLNYLSKQTRERYEYQYATLFEWKLKKIMYFTQNESVYLDSEEKTEDEGTYSWKKDKYEIRKNFKDNTQTDIIEMLGKIYLVNDSLSTQKWQIKNDIREIAGHICMNAFRKDTIKLQNITAWFALDIPIPAGPERNYGLPGLILELDVNDGAMLIEATSVTFKKLNTEMAYPKKIKGKKVTEAEYQAIITKHINDKIKEEEPFFYGIPF